jgi:peptide/nickel transport system permease protein
VASYVIKRLFWAVALFFAITLASFVLFFVIPSEPGRVGVGRSSEATDLRNSLGVQGPIYEEYGTFVWKVLHGSFGESWAVRRDVNEVVLEAIPVTASLVFGGAVIWLLIAIPVGILSAFRPRSLLDRAATVLVLIGISTHPVWIGLILSYYFGAKLELFPVGGYCDLVTPSTRCGGPAQWAYHLVLPWLTFGLLYAAIYMRMIRANVLEAKNEDYVRTARAKGASEGLILRSHILRNASLPIVTMLAMDLGVWLVNAIFVERVYGLPGLGSLFAVSVRRNDLPVVLAIFVLISMTIVIFNLIVDIVYAKLDPRVSLQATDHTSAAAQEPRRGSAAAREEAPAAQPT